MADLIDHHNAMQHEYFRHQILQRLPDPFPSMLPVPAPQRHILMAPVRGLPNVEVQLQNGDLWSQFHQIGTEMIITKSGRRMFPSLRLTITGLEEDTNYCVLLEMVPIGDCRYKFSGSQWVPAGGAEPQSPHRMYLHQDSPARGSHWAAQPVLFNKVKLTNNTLDCNGHIVLTSMHKYQPRIHIIQTSDPAHIPWAPQSSFTFNETGFVAVTAYQNDRITKLKIDNNPFAKGFRETGQSRCKRKIISTPGSKTSSNSSTSLSGSNYDLDYHQLENDAKRMRANSSTCSVSSLDDSALSVSDGSSGTSSPPVPVDDLSSINRDKEILQYHHHQRQQQIEQSYYSSFNNNFIHPWMDMAFSYLNRPAYSSFPMLPKMELPPPSQIMFGTEIPLSYSRNATAQLSSEKMKPTKVKSKSFTISAILGNER